MKEEEMNNVNQGLKDVLARLRAEGGRLRRSAKNELDPVRRAAMLGGASGTLKTVEAIAEVCISCGLI
jgi:hypothetical protein